MSDSPYRLSFTTGGLLMQESAMVGELYLKNRDWQLTRDLVRSDIRFTWEFDATGTIHARHIVTDHGWKILLDRGLDVFQRYEMNDAFDFANRLQQHRQCKAFEVTFIRTNF